MFPIQQKLIEKQINKITLKYKYVTEPRNANLSGYSDDCYTKYNHRVTRIFDNNGCT